MVSIDASERIWISGHTEGNADDIEMVCILVAICAGWIRLGSPSGKL